MNHKRQSCCGSPEHTMNRRLFLQGGVNIALGVGLAGLGAPLDSLLANEIKKKHKHVLLLWLAGGSSQLETWDPKPGRPTGGPFRAIPTAVPGVHICELLPKMAGLMDRVALVRSLDTRIADHGQAADLMQRGRRPEAELAYPDFGSVITKELSQGESAVPEYVSLYLATEGQPWAGRRRDSWAAAMQP